MNASRIEAELRVLLDAQAKAVELGQGDEANRLLARARSLAPNHEAVLNVMAINALRAGNAPAARELLERAVGRRPGLGALWLNLAAACRALGDDAGEGAALERGLAIEPRDYLAQLHLGELRARQQQEAPALAAFEAALAFAPPPNQVPAGVGQRLDQAIGALRARTARAGAALEAALAPLRAGLTVADTDRFDLGLAAMLGVARIYPSQPTYFQLPELPARPLLGREAFPWLAALEARTEALAAEAESLLAAGSFGPGVRLERLALSEPWARLNHGPGFAVAPVIRCGEAEGAGLAPAAVAAAESVPLFDVPGCGPNVYYAVLEPGVAIPPATGVTNARATIHLPLAVPDGLQFRVGARRVQPVRGEAVVFDDSIENELANGGAARYVVLVLDVWNPLVTDAEITLIRTACTASPDLAGRPAWFAFHDRR